MVALRCFWCLLLSVGACFISGHQGFAAQDFGSGKGRVLNKSGGLSSPVLIEDVWARPGTRGGNTAVFFRITLPGEQDRDVLSQADSTAADRVELHTHIKDGEVYRMRKVDRMVVHGAKGLEPGGDHVMLIGLKEHLEENHVVPLTLTFEKAGQLSLKVPVGASRRMLGQKAPK